MALFGRRKDEPVPATTPEDQELALDALIADPKQARLHDERNLKGIEDSIRAVGWAEGGVLDEGNRILVGNGRRTAGKRAGIKKARVVEVDGTKAVFIRRRGLTEAQKRTLAAASNRTAELATWDAGAMRELKGEADFSGLWSESEFERLTGTRPAPKAKGRRQEPTEDPDEGLTTGRSGADQEPPEPQATTKVNIYLGQEELARWNVAMARATENGTAPAEALLLALRRAAG